MRYSRVDIIVILQVLLLALNPILFSIALYNESPGIIRSVLVVTWVLQLIFLLKYLRRSEKSLRQALAILRSGEDYHALSKSSMSRTHNDVLDEINSAISVFRNLKIEKEVNLLFFMQIMENMPSGIIVLNYNEKIEFINRFAIEMLDISRPDSLSDLEKVRPGFSFWLRDIIRDNNVIDIKRKEKSLKLSISVREIRIKNERPKRIYSMKDIRNELNVKEIEIWHNMLRILSPEVLDSVNTITLSAMSMRSSLNEMKKIMGLSEESEKIHADFDKELSVINERGKYLNSFIELVKSLIKIPEPAMETIKLRNLVKDSVDKLRLDLQDRPIHLKEDIEDIELVCDKRLINHVIINLVMNSVKSIPDNEEMTIKINASCSDGNCLISIEDNGPGIPEDIQNEMLSSPFNSKSHDSGFDLSFARQVMKLHNGDINVLSTPGRTVFTLTLPESITF